MRFKAVVGGVGMTRFGKHMDTGLKALGAEAVQAAIADAGIQAGDIEAAFVGNAAAGLVTGQECIRGQVILRSIGIGRIPVVNVENACASASTALHQACAMVSAGLLRHRARARRREALPPRQAQELRRVQRRGGCRDPANAARGPQGERQVAGRGGRRGRRRREAVDVHGHLRRRGTQPHAEVRHHRPPVRRGGGQEFIPRQHESARAVSGTDDRGPGPRRTDDRRAADAADVLADRRRRRGGARDERTGGAGARRARPGARGQHGTALRLGSQHRRAGHGRGLHRKKPSRKRASDRKTSTSWNATTPPRRPN